MSDLANGQYLPWYDIDELMTAATGRWKDILGDAGGISLESLDGRGHPCPQCGGRDRFSAFADVAQRGSIHCRRCFHRETDPRPGNGIASLRWLLKCDTPTACRWLARWLGGMAPSKPKHDPRLQRSVVIRSLGRRGDRFDYFAKDCHAAMRSTWWNRLQDRLGLPERELKRLRVGWSAKQKTTTWPMVDHDDRVVGVRLRCMETGRKWSASGGREGVFVPVGLSVNPDPLFIAEGPTDTAAILSLGLDCIGRPSCNGAIAITTKLVDRLRPPECVIIADADANDAGIRGAESLAVTLVTVCPIVKIISPPAGINDARDWIRSGADREDVMRLVRVAPARSLSLEGSR